jgi:hypothetical protein
MLCSIYFSLYCVLILLTPFSPPEVATTPTLLMHNENLLVDIYIWDLYTYDETLMYMDDIFMCMDKT